MMNIEHIFFDLDHTLWDFEKNSAKAFEFIFRKHDVKISLGEFLSIYKPLNFAFWKLYREDKISKRDLRYERLKQSFDGLRYEVNDELITKLSVDYVENLANFNHLFDDTMEILEYLKPKYQMHIITNGFIEIQEKKMRNANINTYFKHVITSESVGVKKPNPRIFAHALDLAGTSADKSIMIGDSLEADILGAQKSGIKTIFFNSHNEQGHDQVRTIHHLMELKKYL